MTPTFHPAEPSPVARWHRLEDWIETNEIVLFTVYDYANATDIPVREASLDIYAHQGAQRGPNSTTLNVVNREPDTRTRNAIWRVGARKVDARNVGRTLASDTTCRVMRAFSPDLGRIAVLNPKAAKQCEAQVESVVGHALAILTFAAQGYEPPPEE